MSPIVYICSPYAGDVERNVAAARRYCRFAYENDALPFAPHLLFPQFMDDGNPDERRDALVMGEMVMDICDELWIFGDEVSPGMAVEIDCAKKKFMKIRRFGDV